MAKFLKTTVLGGIVFLIPIVIFIVIIGKAIQLVNKLTTPLSAIVPVDGIGGVAVADLLAIVAILLICFFSGLAAKSALARKLVVSLESRVLSNIPVYGYLKNRISAIVQPSTAEGMQPVLLRFDDYWQVALEVERIHGGRVTVYLPGAPDPWSGSVCYVTEDRVQPLDSTLLPVIGTLKGLGRGSEALLSNSAHPG